MKKLLIPAVFILITMAVLAYFLLRHSPPSDLMAELTEDQLTAWKLMEMARQLCVSGQSKTVVFDIKAAFSKEPGVSASGTDKRAEGAIHYLNETIRDVQDSEIRACLQQHFSNDIKNCMLNRCGASTEPKQVDFKFSYHPHTAADFIDPDTVFFGLRNREIDKKLVRQLDKLFEKSLPFPAANEELVAWISPSVVNGFQSDISDKVNISIKRALSVPGPNGHVFTRYHCSTDQGCIWDKTSPHFLDVFPFSVSLRGSSSFWVASANAASQSGEAWAIPDLDYLRHHADARKIGYTHFVIETAEPPNVDADAYYMDVKVNGMAAYEDGAPGAYRVRPLNEGPLRMEFGLQNLNFDGRNSGCDQLEVRVQFLKEGREVAPPVVLQRSYVALRNAGRKRISSDLAEWSWYGDYKRAHDDFDYEVFISSVLVDRGIDFSSHGPQMKRAVSQMNDTKRRFDSLNIEYEGSALVAVLRPPLTQISYGIAVGEIEQSGQIRFTFSRDKAHALGDFLQAERATNAEAGKVIAAGKYIYKIRGDEDHLTSPPICPGEGVI